MELFSADGVVPDDLGVVVVCEKGDVAGAVAAEAGDELRGGEHDAGVEEPSVGDAEAVDDFDGGGVGVDGGVCLADVEEGDGG